MKKLSIFLPIMFIVTLVFANKLFSGSATKLVNKEISLSVFTDNNYTTAAYDSSLAQVEVTVEKVTGNATHIIASKKYNAMQLKQYANEKSAMKEKMQVFNVKDGKEYLVITYTVAYNTKGSLLTFEKKEVIGKGVDHTKINIVI